MNTEIWKPIQDYEGYYEVSNFGNVRSVERYVSNHTGQVLLKSCILKQGKNYKGYPIVYLSKEGRSKTILVHRLVAKAFVINRNNKPQVNHIDGNKENNMVSNLEWVNNSENQLHAYKLGLNYVTGRAGKPKKKVLQINKGTGEVIAEYNSVADAARSVGCKSSSNISACCKNNKGRKTICGFAWKYKEVV